MSNDDLPEDFKIINHPLEQVLDIEPGSTLLPTTEHRKTEIASAPSYDEVDNEINEQFQEVFDVAMDAYEQQAQDIETVDPKYRARNQEVAVQYLNTALSAAKEKNNIKQFKDKLVVKEAVAGPKTLNQQVVIADRNDMLKGIVERMEGKDG